jgi:hypothetical protein
MGGTEHRTGGGRGCVARRLSGCRSGESTIGRRGDLLVGRRVRTVCTHFRPAATPPHKSDWQLTAAAIYSDLPWARAEPILMASSLNCRTMSRPRPLRSWGAPIAVPLTTRLWCGYAGAGAKTARLMQPLRRQRCRPADKIAAKQRTGGTCGEGERGLDGGAGSADNQFANEKYDLPARIAHWRGSVGGRSSR